MRIACTRTDIGSVIEGGSNQREQRFVRGAHHIIITILTLLWIVADRRSGPYIDCRCCNFKFHTAPVLFHINVCAFPSALVPLSDGLHQSNIFCNAKLLTVRTDLERRAWGSACTGYRISCARTTRAHLITTLVFYVPQPSHSRTPSDVGTFYQGRIVSYRSASTLSSSPMSAYPRSAYSFIDLCRAVAKTTALCRFLV
ncbi:hypothetical protein ARMGADRAFT_537756 [Armillaria gallica]|uniref:Uncharacterized protein n=1 Tax=Armillaria gallica TaxID=47427 RepID=A0A2H3CWJ0_ARMGA|nr:hypothetical protein ARMGADRAFT_537756 [Armillaria gallica]